MRIVQTRFAHEYELISGKGLQVKGGGIYTCLWCFHTSLSNLKYNGGGDKVEDRDVQKDSLRSYVGV